MSGVEEALALPYAMMYYPVFGAPKGALKKSPKAKPKRPKKVAHETREGWLAAAIVALDEKFFKENGYELTKNLKASVGFVGGKAIGVCHPASHSADETFEMFICPTQGDQVRVLDILLHEMIHVYCPAKTGHKGPFKKMALEFGLTGKMTATVVVEGSDLHKSLLLISGRLGKYPHSAMSPKKKLVPSDNKWVRYVSPNYDTYKVVVNIDRVEEFGAPKDPMGHEMEPVN